MPAGTRAESHTWTAAPGLHILCVDLLGRESKHAPRCDVTAPGALRTLGFGVKGGRGSHCS